MPPPQANAMAPPPPVGEPLLEDDDTDDMPFAVNKQAAAPVNQAAPSMNQNSVNVQTTNQPVLVVPLSMNQAPAKTELIPPPAPGAPSTLAVDTSENAMRNLAPKPPSARPTSPPAAKAAVNVNKLGNKGTAPPPAANVRVSVNKLG